MTTGLTDSLTAAPRPRRPWMNVAVIVAATLVALAGFAADFVGAAFVLPALGGVAVGGAVAWAAARWRLSILLTAIAGLSAYFVIGTPFTMPSLGIVGVVPSARTLAGLAIGSIHGWKDIVTLTTPIEAPYYLTVVPFLSGLVAALIGCSLAFRWLQSKPRTPTRSLVALSPAIVLYTATVLLGTREPTLPVVRGVMLALLALVWIAWRQPAQLGSSSRARTALLRRRLIGTSVVAAGAVLIAAVALPTLMPPNEDRFVLREKIAPPFDPAKFPSPLSGFRHYTKDANEDTLFTVTGLLPGDTIRLATMDTYNGKLWDVTSGGLYADASGTFALVGKTLPQDDPVDDATTRSVEVTVGTYSDIWLPIVGEPSSITFGKNFDVDATALRYNAGTRDGVVITGLKSGMTYDLTTTDTAVPSDDQLAGVAVAQMEQPPISNVPSLVEGKAEEYSEGQTTPIGQLRAIESTLKEDGFLSHGAESDMVPSLAGHGADRLTTLFEKSQLIGDQEQYAAAFALMARELGYPARVVMGFAPKVSDGASTTTVTGDDVTAWVEVPFEGYGWVPFFPTPEKTDVPKSQDPRPRAEPQPQVRQPPRDEDIQDAVASPVQIDQKDEKDKPDPPAGIPGWATALMIGVGVVLALYLVPVLTLVALKARRRARRRGKGPDHMRAAGAWDEVEDAYAELGYSIPERGTRVDKALDFEDQLRTEIAARTGERDEMRRRAAEKASARLAKLEERQQGADVKSPLLAFREATVLRAKQESVWHPGVSTPNEALAVLPGLRELAVDADEAVFSGEPVDDDRLQAVWAAADEALSVARKSVTWMRRQVGRFRYRFRRLPRGATPTRVEKTTSGINFGVFKNRESEAMSS